jgi:NADPH2:quinone reductase
MRAIAIAAPGGPEVLRSETRPDPVPGDGEIVVRNAATGLNFIDIYQRRGLYPVALPAVLGCEGAGEVIALGADVNEIKVGDRVAWLAGGGGYAELTAVPAGMAARLPPSFSFDLAASSFLKGLTAEMLIRRVYPLAAGARALVYAAAGGVGTILTQWAASLGAHVIAVVGDDRKAALARQYGAADVIIRTKTESIANKVREATGGEGVDVVYDSVGAATFEASLDSLKPQGMMVSYGNASGPVPPFAPFELGRRGSLFFTRPSLFHYATPARLPEMADALFDAIGYDAVRLPEPQVFPLDGAAKAHALLESGATTGAIVLRP